MEDLIAKLKISLGDMSGENELVDKYYKEKIVQAYADLSNDDISESVLSSELGKATIIHYATLLVEKKDIASNPTLTLLRNKLSDMTKGERVSDV